MKIRKARANNRRRVFEVDTVKGTLVFPYAQAEPTPSPADRVSELYVDPELGNEGFTYELESGREGSVHIDSVLEYNKDPDYLASIIVHEFTAEVKKCLEESSLPHREIIRRLNTSASQLYRIVDVDNVSKPLRQVFALLQVLDYDVAIQLKKKKPSSQRQRKKRSLEDSRR